MYVYIHIYMHMYIYIYIHIKTSGQAGLIAIPSPTLAGRRSSGTRRPERPQGSLGPGPSQAHVTGRNVGDLEISLVDVIVKYCKMNHRYQPQNTILSF